MPRSALATALGPLVGLAAAVVAGLLPACSSQPRIQTGALAIKTPDGLHKVDDVPMGNLFMKPDYAFGSYQKFVLGQTIVTFRRDSRVLGDDEIEAIKARFNAIARAAILETGRTEVSAPGPCVAIVNLGLVDLDLLDPKDLGGGAGTSVITSFGALTLVLEIRDGHTGEALLRYGRRRRLEGGYTHGVDPAEGTALSTAFSRFAIDFQKDFQRSLPRIAPSAHVRSCEERAGLTASHPLPGGARPAAPGR